VKLIGGVVVVVPFTVALNVTEYFPGGVAVPVGLFGKLAHAAPPKAISVSTANDSAHRGSRLLIVSTTPPNINPRSSTPSPPPDPPGVGPSGAVFAVQNVFSTIATSVGPPGVRVTLAGSGWHVIVGDEVAQLNVTVPLKPGIAVSTIPTANLPPGGTGGNDPPGGGVTEIVIGEFVSVSSVEPVTSFNVADIVVLESALGPVVARPVALIVAASVFDDAHVAVVVRSFVLLSENVPVAVNCCVELIGTVGFAGVTAIDFNVGALSVNVAVTIVAVSGIVNVHVRLVVFGQIALQLVNAEFAPAIAISWTSVPAAKFAVQPAVDPLTQLIPAPVTVPAPVPAV
jgi:hypothetical protein